MALLWFEGWDSYNNGNAPPIVGIVGNDGLNIASGAGRFGGNAAHGDGNSPPRGLVLLTSASSELWWAQAYMTVTGGATPVGFVYSAAGLEFQMQIAFDTGVVQFFDGNGNLKGTAASAPMLSLGTWHWLEWRVKLGSSQGSTDGEVELWVDNTQITLQTGLATRTQTGTGGFTQAGIVGAQRFFDATVDDMYILDTTGPAPYNTRLGDSRIDSIAPTSDAGPNDGTPSTSGPHWEMFAMNPGYNPADMITLNNVTGQEEVFGIGAAAAASDVWAVNVVYDVQKTNAGSAGITPEVVIAGTAFEGSVFSPSTSFAFAKSLWTANPATSAPWTAADITAMDIGLITS